MFFLNVISYMILVNVTLWAFNWLKQYIDCGKTSLYIGANILPRALSMLAKILDHSPTIRKTRVKKGCKTLLSIKITKACLTLAIKYVDELQDFWDNIL